MSTRGLFLLGDVAVLHISGMMSKRGRCWKNNTKKSAIFFTLSHLRIIADICYNTTRRAGKGSQGRTARDDVRRGGFRDCGGPENGDKKRSSEKGGAARVAGVPA